MSHSIPESVVGTDDRVLATVASILPSLPNVRADDADRFAQATRAIIEKRAQDNWPNEGKEDVAVFVMVDHPRRIGQQHGAKPFLDLIATKEPLLGRLFLCNRDASQGQALPMPVPDQAQILDWLRDNNLSGRPIVIIYRQSKTMVTRRAGVDDLARQDPIRETPLQATVAELLAALEYFYINKLLTPSCCVSGVWEPERESQYVPGPQPEKSIQNALIDALNFTFQGIVRAETEDKTNNIGRIDVRLLRSIRPGEPLAYWAIVELKVVKSFANAPKGKSASKIQDTSNAEAVAEGLRQAWAFRKNREADEGLLEVFDLRRDKSQDILQHDLVKEVISKFTPVPTYNIRALFGSSSHARSAGFAGV